MGELRINPCCVAFGISHFRAFNIHIQQGYLDAHSRKFIKSTCEYKKGSIHCSTMQSPNSKKQTNKQPKNRKALPNRNTNLKSKSRTNCQKQSG